MNYNTKKGIQESFKKHFNKKDDDIEDFDVRHDANILMYRFLSEIERLLEEKDITKKELAKMIGISPSYITQLFRGNKLLNLETAAKFQRALDIKFSIKAYPKDALIKGDIVFTTIFQIESSTYNYYYDEIENYLSKQSLESLDFSEGNISYVTNISFTHRN